MLSLDDAVRVVYLHSQDEGIPLDIVPCFENIVWDKFGVAEAKLVYILDRLLKMLPCGVGDKALCDVGSFVSVCVLVVEREWDGKEERPVKDVVILSLQYLDVDGQILALPWTISIEKHWGSHLVAIPWGIKRFTDNFSVFVHGLYKLLFVVCDFPDECTVCDLSDGVQGVTQVRDLRLLFLHEVAHELQVVLGAVVKVTIQTVPGSL